MSRAYYNENDPYCAQWLKNLIAEGLIAPGDVDDRSIKEVSPSDLEGYTQCHFFAGIGIWSAALRQANWSDNKPVWTASCPCQPFSQSGKRKGKNDERHLWPTLNKLIKNRKPEIIFGEQVSSRDGLAWFDTVQADVKKAGYSSAGVDLSGAGIGAPHIRQRLYWVAYASSEGLSQREEFTGISGKANDANSRKTTESSRGLGNTHCEPIQWQSGEISRAQEELYCQRFENGNECYGYSNASENGLRMGNADSYRFETRNKTTTLIGHRNSINSTGWNDVQWINFSDGKTRPIKPGIKPVVNGNPGRVGQVRAYGNAIILPLASKFIEYTNEFLSSETQQAMFGG